MHLWAGNARPVAVQVATRVGASISKENTNAQGGIVTATAEADAHHAATGAVAILALEASSLAAYEAKDQQHKQQRIVKVLIKQSKSRGINSIGRKGLLH